MSHPTKHQYTPFVAQLEGVASMGAAASHLVLQSLVAQSANVVAKLATDNERLEAEVRAQHAAYNAMFDRAAELERKLSGDGMTEEKAISSKKDTVFAFGDIVENGYASVDNPTRRGIVIKFDVRYGALNPGAYYELTDGKGKYWEVPVANDRLSKVGTALSADSCAPETSLRPGELEQLRRIDRAARKFVDAFQSSAVKSYIGWKELNEALFDGRPSAQETSPSPGANLCHWARCHQPKAPGEAFLCAEHAWQRDNGTLPNPDYDTSEADAPKSGAWPVVSAEEAKHPLAFRHWSKDPAIPYPGCQCATCSAQKASVNPHCLQDGVPCASDGRGGCLACTDGKGTLNGKGDPT